MILDRRGTALRLADLPMPRPGRGELLIAVEACGVCRPDLHLLDGELPKPQRFPPEQANAALAQLRRGAAVLVVRQ